VIVLFGFLFVMLHVSLLQGRMSARIPYLTFRRVRRLLWGKLVLMIFSIRRMIRMTMTGTWYLPISIWILQVFISAIMEFLLHK